MKRLLIFLTALLLLTGCLAKERQDYPKEMTVQEVLTKLADKKNNSFLLYLTTAHCYSCDEFEKVVEELEKKERFEVYKLYIDLEEEDEEALQALQELNVTIGNVEEFPMVYYFYQGSLQQENIKKGYQDEEVMRKWLKNLHILH